MTDRQLHPGAWWTWALLLAAAAAATTNVLVLALIASAVCVVVMTRRSDAPWALGFHQYLIVAAVILVLRIIMRLIFRYGDELGVALHAGAADGMRLAVMIVCIGAANALANPKQLLASLPAALYEIGTAVVIALTFFPQLVESVQRVGRARRLRSATPIRTGRWRRTRSRARAVREVLLPVVEDAFDRSLQLAASMDARGYGRAGRASRAERRRTGALLVLALIGSCVGMYATLDATSPRVLATPMLLSGLACAAFGFRSAGTRVARTRYRPHRWRLADAWVITCGGAALALVIVATRLDPAAIRPVGLALELPPLTLLPMCAALAAAGAAIERPNARRVHQAAGHEAEAGGVA